MNCNECVNFVLDNSLAAVSAAMNGKHIYATDGHDCKIYKLKCGCDVFCIPVMRPYRRLRTDPGSGGNRYTALSGNCRRIYFLCRDFAESGFADLETGFDGDTGEITDAGITYVGGNPFIFASFDRNAYLFDMCGNRLSSIYSSPDGTLLTGFLSVTPTFYAASYIAGDFVIISVYDNGNTYTAIVPPGLSLRMLFAGDDGIYALFGANYIYNRICKIYTAGSLILPNGCT